MARENDILLDSHWTSVLAQWRENGMGFHLVDMVLDDGRSFESVPVFNLEHAILPNEAGKINSTSIAEMKMHKQ